MYLTHPLMVIDQSAKFDMPMSKLTEVTGRTWQKPLNLTLRSKVNIESGSWMYLTHWLMVIHPCAKYGKPMSNHKKLIGRTRKHVKNPINLTLRSKFKVVSGSWMYATHRLMVIHPCAKYGKPMSNHKKVMGRKRICTDRRTDTDRQSDSYIPPWTSFAGGIITLHW